MTNEEQRQYTLGGEIMRERIVSLIYDYYVVLKTHHGRSDDRCALLRNIVHDIREDHASELERESLA
jgi:hypothetical protein